MKLMERTGVIVTPGSAFGSNGEGYVRMALVVNESVIEEIVDVLDASGIFKIYMRYYQNKEADI